MSMYTFDDYTDVKHVYIDPTNEARNPGTPPYTVLSRHILTSLPGVPTNLTTVGIALPTIKTKCKGVRLRETGASL